MIMGKVLGIEQNLAMFSTYIINQKCRGAHSEGLFKLSSLLPPTSDILTENHLPQNSRG